MSDIDLRGYKYYKCYGGLAIFTKSMAEDNMYYIHNVCLNRDMCITNEAGLFRQKIHPLEIPDLNLAEYFNNGHIILKKAMLTTHGFIERSPVV